MNPRSFSMVQECVDRYEVRDRPDGGVDILIAVPPDFKNLWLVKLSELEATDGDLEEYGSGEGDRSG